MSWWNKRKQDTEHIERKIAENEEATEETREARKREAALTPVIREEVTALVERGKRNRFGESLMLAWQLKEQHSGNG